MKIINAINYLQKFCFISLADDDHQPEKKEAEMYPESQDESLSKTSDNTPG